MPDNVSGPRRERPQDSPETAADRADQASLPIRNRALTSQDVITLIVAIAAMIGVARTSSLVETAAVFAAIGVLTVGAAWPDWVGKSGPYAAVAGALGSYFIFRGVEVDREFYVVAAEVIPLLFLAMVAGKLLVFVDRPEPERRIKALVIYFLVLGEGFSLYVLASENQPSSACGWTIGALAAAAIAIISGAVAGRDE
jgi:hypothetical protein